MTRAAMVVGVVLALAAGQLAEASNHSTQKSKIVCDDGRSTIQTTLTFQGLMETVRVRINGKSVNHPENTPVDCQLLCANGTTVPLSCPATDAKGKFKFDDTMPLPDCQGATVGVTIDAVDCRFGLGQPAG